MSEKQSGKVKGMINFNDGYYCIHGSGDGISPDG